MGDDKARDALADAQAALGILIYKHTAAAIPAMIVACVSWAIENGAPDLIESSLRNAADIVQEADAAWKKALD